MEQDWNVMLLDLARQESWCGLDAGEEDAPDVG